MILLQCLNPINIERSKIFRYLCGEILQNEVFNGQFNESSAVYATADKKKKIKQANPRSKKEQKKWSKVGQETVLKICCVLGSVQGGEILSEQGEEGTGCLCSLTSPSVSGCWGLIPPGCGALDISPAETGLDLSWGFASATRIPLLLLGGFEGKEGRQQGCECRVTSVTQKMSPVKALRATL